MCGGTGLACRQGFHVRVGRVLTYGHEYGPAQSLFVSSQEQSSVGVSSALAMCCTRSAWFRQMTHPTGPMPTVVSIASSPLCMRSNQFPAPAVSDKSLHAAEALCESALMLANPVIIGAALQQSVSMHIVLPPEALDNALARPALAGCAVLDGSAARPPHNASSCFSSVPIPANALNIQHNISNVARVNVTCHPERCRLAPGYRIRNDYDNLYRYRIASTRIWGYSTVGLLAACYDLRTKSSPGPRVRVDALQLVTHHALYTENNLTRQTSAASGLQLKHPCTVPPASVVCPAAYH